MRVKKNNKNSRYLSISLYLCFSLSACLPVSQSVSLSFFLSLSTLFLSLYPLSLSLSLSLSLFLSHSISLYHTLSHTDLSCVGNRLTAVSNSLTASFLSPRYASIFAKSSSTCKESWGGVAKTALL